MKFINYLILILLISCKPNNDKRLVISTVAPKFAIKYDSAKYSIRNDQIGIYFRSQFINDTILIYSGSKILFKDIITTDDILDYAHEAHVNRKNIGQGVYLMFNSNGKVNIKNFNDYNFIIVEKRDTVISIEFTNNIPIFK